MVEQLAVHPFVVHGQANGLAHPRIFEFGQTGVEHKALKVAGIAMLQLFFDEGAVVKQFALVAPCPFTGHKGLDVVELARFETFKLRGGVFVEPVADAVEIEHAFAHIQVFRPVVVVTHILNIFAKVDLPELVGTRADRHIGDDLVQGLVCAPLVAEHRHAAHNQRQFSIGAFEIETHLAVRDHHHAGHFAEIGTKLRRGFLAGEAVERILHIQSQHGVAIVKTSQRVKAKGHRQFVFGHAHVFGQQTISGGGFVAVASQQSLQHQAAQSWGCIAFQGEGVVFVKTGSAAGRDHGNLTALGGSGVDIAEMAEALRVFDVPKLGISMGRPNAG